MSVLVLGVLSYPSALPNLDQDITAFDFQQQLGNVAFADDEEEENGEEEEEEDEIEFEGTITAIVKDVSFELLLEDCTTVTIFTDDTSGLILDFEVEVEVVLSNSSLVATEIEIEEEDEEEYEEEYEIEVEVKKGKAKIKIELDDEKYRFVLTGNPTDADIISAIVEKTGLDPSFITSIWDYEVEEEDEDMSSKIMHEHEEESMQTALDLIYELQQRIEQLEDRIQTLLEKYESGEYFGTVPEVDSEIKSYTIFFDGSATSIDDESIVIDVEGEIFLENLLTFGDNISKFRVTGGEISIDNTFYDIVFGKARVSSSSSSGEKDIVVLLGQVIDFADEDDDSSTLKLVINSETSLEGDFGLVPISIEILPQSKIAGQWYLSGSGQLSLLEG